MRAREFIIEQADLPAEIKDPMRNTYVLPGLSASTPYQNYRFGVALARARSDQATDDVNKFKPAWTAETAFGEHAVIAGFDNNVDPVIDAALGMTRTPGGKKLVSTAASEEPRFIDAQSPIIDFKGYL